MNNSGKTPPPFVAASDRNKQPILETLQKIIPESCSVLEIGSGWGQHACHFCRAIPGLNWQPSDRIDKLPALVEQIALNSIDSIRQPIALDVLNDPWPAGPYDVVYTANTAHIMPWRAVTAMISGAGTCLVESGLLCIYGPFNIDGEYTSIGNEEFDQKLRANESERGIRDAEALERVALDHQMILQERVSMPANNFLLVFRKLKREQSRDE
jgi:hypothetical protein